MALENERFGSNRPSHDPRVVQRLMEEEGYTEREALIIATTEMEGAFEIDDPSMGEVGDVRARQTYCDTLREPETLPRARGAEEGRKACLKAKKEWLQSNS